MMDIGRFSGGVGALLYDSHSHKYLLLKRAATKDFAAGVWECVTGRVDQGEGFEDAVRREVREEVGLEVDIDFIIGTTHFYRGEPGPETEIIGVVYACTIAGTPRIRISPEHSEYRWVTAEESDHLLVARDLSTQWTRRVIARAEEIRQYLPTALAQYYRENGFELG